MNVRFYLKSVLFYSQRFFFKVGKVSYFLIPSILLKYAGIFLNYFYSGRISMMFMSCGKNLYVIRSVTLWNPNRIIVGDDVSIHKNAILATHSNDARLEIGNGVVVGEYCHITALNNITIADGVLMGKKCLISDNNHGKIGKEEIMLPPNQRKIISKGKVYIGRNAWLGDNVVVLPGVYIGEGCIIGASSVVTKSIPPYTVCAGNPAKIIKIITES